MSANHEIYRETSTEYLKKSAIIEIMKTIPNVVILTGSGISAESGIQTFRDSGGLWENHCIEDVATFDAFQRDPNFVQSFYNQRRRQLLSTDVAPNAAHYALADLGQHLKDNLLLITQNIDDLHERAGSRNLIHMHGELLKMRCIHCQKTFPIQRDISTQTTCPCCNQTQTLRPDIVWFGEMPYGLDEIYDAIHACDIFVAIGTSGNVYPAAGFVELAQKNSTHCIEINLEPSQTTTKFQQSLYGYATKTIPLWVNDFKRCYPTTKNKSIIQDYTGDKK